MSKTIARIASLVSMLIAGPALAQLPTIKLTTVFPPAGQQGATAEITLAGSDMEGMNTLHFSRPGITATFVNGTQFKVAVDANTPAGLVDVCAAGTWGVSNPRAFLVTSLPQQNEAEPNNQVAEAKEVALNSAVNGRIDGRADVDHYKFKATKGQRVAIDCYAERIDSRLAAVLTIFDQSGKRIVRNMMASAGDPRLSFVPEVDGEYVVRVQDLLFNGSAEYFYHLEIHTKPLVDFAYPPSLQAGATAAIKIYGVNLPGGAPDPAAQTPCGPLDAASAIVQAPSDPVATVALPTEAFLRPRQAFLDAFVHRLQPAMNPVLIGVSPHPVIAETEPNNENVKATRGAVPAEFVGRFDTAGDVDWFRFPAKKGQTLTIEAFSERSGFETDVRMVLHQLLEEPKAADQPMKVQTIGEYDDDATNVGRTKFITSTHDPQTNFSVPIDGEYLLEVYDNAPTVRDSRAVYRIRVAPTAPDFRLGVQPSNDDAPSSIVVWQGGTAYVHVFAIRQRGFAGEIQVQAEGLPPGVSAPPIVIGSGVNEAALVFKAEDAAAETIVPITIKGTATINGAAVVRTARIGSIVWPQGGGGPRPARLTQSCLLAVRKDAPYRLEATADQTTIGQGSLLRVGLKLNRRWPDYKGKLTGITALHLPANVDNQTIEIGDNQTDSNLFLTFKNNVAPGTYSFIVRGTGQVAFTKTPQDPKAQKANINVLDPSLPVTVTVINRPVEVSLNPNAPTVKAGATVNVKVGVKRVNNYTGPVKLRLVVPPGVAGITAAEVDVAADKNEAEFVLAAAGDAAAGKKASLTVRAVATVDGKPVPVDGVFTLDVTK